MSTTTLTQRRTAECIHCCRRTAIRAYGRCSDCATHYVERVPLYRRTRRPDGAYSQHGWQAYGRYTEVPLNAPFHNVKPGEDPWFASPVNASNEYMARWRVLQSVFPYGPVIDSIRPIETGR